MSIRGSAVLVGGTPSASGGTSTDLVVKNSLVQNQMVMTLDDSSEFIDETKITFSSTDPKVSVGAPNGYTQARSNLVISRPLALDNGEYTTNTFRATLSVDPETTDAEVAELLSVAAQILFGSDFSDFWDRQRMD
jgi:hypothetical protein